MYKLKMLLLQDNATVLAQGPSLVKQLSGKVLIGYLAEVYFLLVVLSNTNQVKNTCKFLQTGSLNNERRKMMSFFVVCIICLHIHYVVAAVQGQFESMKFVCAMSAKVFLLAWLT